MRPSRREFVKWVTASGIALSLSRLAVAQERDFAALPGRQKWNPAANGGGRIDGVAKVTGAKLYASDYRANDLPGWPATTRLPAMPDRNDLVHRHGAGAAPPRHRAHVDGCGGGMRRAEGSQRDRAVGVVVQ